jgi:ABC-type arginine transport system permease subunit
MIIYFAIGCVLAGIYAAINEYRDNDYDDADDLFMVYVVIIVAWPFLIILIFAYYFTKGLLWLKDKAFLK